MALFGAKGTEPYTILGEIPNGGPGSDAAPAVRAPIEADKVHQVLRAARDVLLTATGPRDGVASPIDKKAFDAAIRSYMPLGHYERSPNQAISVMDYKVYACRVVHRLLTAIGGKKVVLPGGYSSHLATNARAAALYDVLLDVAATTGVEDFVRVGWDARLAKARTSCEAAEGEQRREEDKRSARAAEERRICEVQVEAAQQAQRERDVAQVVERERTERELALSKLEERHRLQLEQAAERARAEAQSEEARLREQERAALTLRMREEVEVATARAREEAEHALAIRRDRELAESERERIEREMALSRLEQRHRQEVEQAAERGRAEAQSEEARIREQERTALTARMREEVGLATARAREEAEHALAIRRERELAESERERIEQEAALSKLEERHRLEVKQAAERARAEAERDQAAYRDREVMAARELLRLEVARRVEEELGRLRMQVQPVVAAEAVALDDHSRWESAFENPAMRRVFVHLSEHGSATEEEITGFLGSPRAYRRFALEFEQHARRVPFRVRIEALPDGKRYVKEGEK